jgi:uridine phosphorylase
MRYITSEQIMEGRFAGGRGPDWHAAVLCFRDRSGSGALVRELGAHPLGYKVLWGMDECLTYQTEVSGRPVGVIARCEWGGPQVAVLVEELAQLGVGDVIGLGMAGSIVGGLRKGALVIAGSALVTDGTSRHYTDAALVHPDERLRDAAMAAAARSGLPFRQATVATVDAIYRETAELVRALAEQGGEMLTMETTPLYAASAACGLRSIWIGHISDCLVSEQWEAWDAGVDTPSAATAQLARLLLESI